MERKAQEALTMAGYECYLPIQREVRQWSDRKKVVSRLVLPHMIFVHCTEYERRKSTEEIRYLYRYMCSGGPYTAVIVRDEEMATFISMVEHGGRSVNISDKPLAVGDKVRVVSGPLAGCECELVRVEGNRCLAVRLGAIGTAVMDIESDSVEKI